MNPKVAEIVRGDVEDWDDEVVAAARFKGFSGQRADWEPKYLFWKSLILKVAKHLGVFILSASEIKNRWFARGGLTPLCIDRVLVEMYKDGEILRRGDLTDPTSGRLYKAVKRIGHIFGLSKPLASEEIFEDNIILKPILQERAAEVMKILAENHWTSSCIITMENFRNICKGPDEAHAILSYLCGRGKAHYFSIRKEDVIEGVKVSLLPQAVPSISSLDYDSLHLVWTTEKLHQQLDVIDQRCEKLRKSALDTVKMKNKQAALRYVRQLKLTSESKEKCTVLLNRVEEVINVIASAESTKKVSEAIQIGARAIKENSVSVEEVHNHLQELDESIAYQKQVEEALELPIQSAYIDDEDIEEEFKELEIELGVDTPSVQVAETVSDDGKRKQAEVNEAAKETEAQGSAEILSQTLASLTLEAA